MIILIIKKINKIVHSCNLLRISFFKRCVKEDVVAAVFMFELTLFQIFGLRNDILFCPLYDIPANKYSKWTLETMEKVAKYVQS